MNIFSFFTSMKPFVKCFLFACVTIILVAIMYFGYFDEVLQLFTGDAKK